MESLEDKEAAQDFITTIDTLIGNVRNQTIAGGGVIISSQAFVRCYAFKVNQKKVI